MDLVAVAALGVSDAFALKALSRQREQCRRRKFVCKHLFPGLLGDMIKEAELKQVSLLNPIPPKKKYRSFFAFTVIGVLPQMPAPVIRDMPE